MKNTPKSAFRAIFAYIEKWGDGRGAVFTPQTRQFPLRNRQIPTFLRLSATLLIFCIIIPLTYAEEIRWNDLVEAVIECESRDNPNAVSPKGCIGLMQISRIVLREWNNDGYKHCISAHETGFIKDMLIYTIADLYNPKINKQIGTWYLHRLKDHYLKDNYTIERMLCAWNGGITKLRKLNYDCSKMPKESREFTKKILKLYKRR